MPQLNFMKGKGATAVAIVRGGDMDGRVLYIHPDGKQETPCAGAGRDIDTVRYMKDLKHIKPMERIKVMSELVEGLGKTSADSIADEKTRKVFEDMSKDSAKDNAIVLPDDSTFHCIPNPDPKCRDVYYVAGISGSGKSHFARGIAEAYRKLYPHREVYLISKLQEDDTLDNMKGGKPKRISLDSLVEDYPSIDEFKECLVIADDYDTLDKKYLSVVQKLIDDIAIMGRHTTTTLLALSHYLTNYKSTRLILSESNYIVLYPQATSYKAMKYVCEHQCGMSSEEVQDLKKQGRWVAIKKTFPAFVISAHKAYLLHQ